jgi:hypothetical protein
MNVFLSASFPSGERGERFKPYDPAAISAAVRALARAILLADGRIVFGAHPTISPVILLAASEFEVAGAIDIYQSAYFADQIPEETLRLVELGYGALHMIDADPAADLRLSLQLMRRAMFTEQDVAAGVFVGGMEGIRDEYDLLAELRPDAARLPLTAPGGAARELPIGDDPVSQRLAPVLGDEHYPVVAHEIVAALG